MSQAFSDKPITSGLIAGFRIAALRSQNKTVQLRLEWEKEDRSFERRLQQLRLQNLEADAEAKRDANNLRDLELVRQTAREAVRAGKGGKIKEDSTFIGPPLPTDPLEFNQDEIIALGENAADVAGIKGLVGRALATNAAEAAVQDQRRELAENKAELTSILVQNQIAATRLATQLQERGTAQAHALAFPDSLTTRILQQRQALGVTKPTETIQQALTRGQTELGEQRLDLAREEFEALKARGPTSAAQTTTDRNQLRRLTSRLEKTGADRPYKTGYAGDVAEVRDRFTARKIAVKLGETNATLPSSEDFLSAVIQIKRVSESRDAVTTAETPLARNEAALRFMILQTRTLKLVRAPQSLLDTMAGFVKQQRELLREAKGGKAQSLTTPVRPTTLDTSRDIFILEALRQLPQGTDEEVDALATKLQQEAGGG